MTEVSWTRWDFSNLDTANAELPAAWTRRLLFAPGELPDSGAWAKSETDSSEFSALPTFLSGLLQVCTPSVKTMARTDDAVELCEVGKRVIRVLDEQRRRREAQREPGEELQKSFRSKTVELLLTNSPSPEEVQLLRRAQEENVIDENNVWDTAEAHPNGQLWTARQHPTAVKFCLCSSGLFAVFDRHPAISATAESLGLREFFSGDWAMKTNTGLSSFWVTADVPLPKAQTAPVYV
eukprot:Skav202621  [mRNA]  locus=scaffold515:59399:73358:- [translate_table: standard]